MAWYITALGHKELYLSLILDTPDNEFDYKYDVTVR